MAIQGKRIDELAVATDIKTTDLFVVEQDGVAKSVSGSLMISSLGASVDDELSSTSENPVQNKVIKAALDDISVAGELVCTLMEDGTLYVDNMTAVANFEKEAF